MTLQFKLTTRLGAAGFLMLFSLSALAQTSERRGIGLEPLNATTPNLVNVDPLRSLAVTDEVILEQFSFLATLNAIISRTSTGTGNQTAQALFNQWWDTANVGSTTAPTPHCNTLDANNPNPAPGAATLNGFSYQCPRIEGTQSTTNPFSTGGNGYKAIGLFNRFDLAALDGSDCGEYRIVFAKRSGESSGLNRNLVIFEGTLANPKPHKGINGCIRVAEFWANLSTVASQSVRTQQLKAFYFDGLPGFKPVFHPDSYGAGPTGRGQIRSNQFMQFNWILREFKMLETPACSTRNCGLADLSTLIIKPVTVKVNPAGLLFANASDARTVTFRQEFITQIDKLSVNDINRFDFTPSDRFNGGQSDEMHPLENVYTQQFTSAPVSFKAAIQTKLTAIGSSLTPEHVVARAQALSCAGCHELSVGAPFGSGAPLGGGLAPWPRSQGFTQISEQNFLKERISKSEGFRFGISDALKTVFLPHRKNVLQNFLDARAALPRCDEGCVAQDGSAEISCLEICD